MWRLTLDPVKYMLVWLLGLTQLFMQVYHYNEDSEGILLVNAAKVCINMNRKSNPPHHEFIGIALMTMLANTFCYLCTWTSKQMVLQFQDIRGIGHFLEPLERVIQEKFIPAILG